MLLVRYGEIGLKGQNRHYFEAALVRNIKRTLKPLGRCRVERSHGRIFVHLPEGVRAADGARLLGRVFGVVSVSPVLRVPLELEAVKEAGLELLREAARGGAVTFKVSARRSNKSFPLTSMELNRELGAHILRKVQGLSVDVHEPEVELTVEVRSDYVYLSAAAFPGPGGLPVGTSGKGLLLLSGGIDSPVAGWMTMKRGVDVAAIHFDSYPLTSERARQKVVDLARVLAGYRGGVYPLFISYFTSIQKALQRSCPEELRITLMRRMMFRIAEGLAERRGALVLVTGESVGQVASQTLESIRVINEVVNLPVLRPLAGMDKEEITRKAQEIGTYDISIRPYEDCCTLFVPRRPATRPHRDKVLAAEAELPIEELVEEALEKTELMIVRAEI